MTSMWDSLPDSLRNSGALDGAKSLLQGLTASGPTEVTDSEGTYRTWHADEDLTGPLQLDPRTGAFTSSPGSSGTPIEFSNPHVTADLGQRLTGPGGSPDGGWRLLLTSPGLRLHLPFLKGALLDSQGQLRVDPAHPKVAFLLPRLTIEVSQLAGQSTGVRLRSATTSGDPVDKIYDLIAMDPPYALIGPSDAVGFGFRTAVLDLSGTAAPNVPGVPAPARAMPVGWQGLYLPTARLFVSPNGMEGIAVSAGVQDLWIGFGVHEGVTGVFNAEVVNRGESPTLALHFRTPSGRSIAVSSGAGTVTVALPEQATLFVDVYGGLAPVTTDITVDGTLHHDTDRVDVTTPASGAVSITVHATDGQAHTTTAQVSAQRDTTTSGTTGTGSDRIEVVTDSAQGDSLVQVPAADASKVGVALASGATADWTWTGGSASSVDHVEVPVATGATVSVTATPAAPQVQTLDCYYLFDHPSPSEVTSYPNDPTTTSSAAAAGRGAFTSATDFHAVATQRLAATPAGTTWSVDGYASYEGPEQQPGHNLHLSERRRDVAVAILTSLGFTATAGTANGHSDARTSTDPTASRWWRATATPSTPAAPVPVRGHITRTAAQPPAATDPAPHRPGRPDCFHKLGATVELVRSTFIRCEVYGEFDVETAAESRLAAHGDTPLRTGPRNPQDGVCTFKVVLKIAEDQGSWLASGEFRAAEGDLDGLAQLLDSNSNTAVLDILGAASILAPLASATAELSAAAGDMVELGAVGLGASDLIHTKKLTLRGAEIVTTHGILGADGTTTVSQQGTQVSILLDIEVAFSFDLTLVKVKPEAPIVTRYKAIGMKSSWDEHDAGGGHIDYLPVPVFDPSKGWSLDVPAGSLTAVPPLDNILRILGVRVSRDNPTYLEVEVGLGLDLGIVKIDTVRVRGRVDGPPLDLQLTKFGATLSVPNVLTGKGEVSIQDGGFSASFDVQIIPVKIRAMATFTYRSQNGVTGVLLGIDVEFPVPLLLGNSGLGIFGLMAGIGINHARIPGAGQVEALDWIQQQLSRTGGVMDPAGWQLQQGAFAFAAGVLVGTLEGGYIVHLKGMVMIEVPGPRLLFVMKADVLKKPPALKKANESATFLAVLDIDFGAGTISIGIVAEYTIEKVLHVRIPVTAFFDTNQVEKWLVELGNYQDRVTVTVLEVIEGSGYLMIHGDGITPPSGPPNLPAVQSGLGIAVGFHISAVLMGSKSIGLYLEVAAGFDAVVGFDPFFIAGTIYARGELRLFIISIGASAALTVMIGKREEQGVVHDDPYIHGEVCGEVDLFFFSIKGCVELTIGNQPVDNPTAKPLVGGVTLVSRSPALVDGSAVDRAVDASLGEAVDTADTSHPDLPVVPLDAIPVITFTTPPRVASNAVMGRDPLGQNGAAANPWTRIGDRWWRYDVTAVTLTGGQLLPVGPPDPEVPSSWWTGVPAGTTAPRTALALLDWLPTPFPRAVPYGEELTTQVHERWGTVCHPAAPAAPVLWTFDGKPTGPSVPGWRLQGVPWPDPTGTVRSQPAAATALVTEPWRSSDDVVDRIQGTSPAVVLGDSVRCPGRRVPGIKLLGPALASHAPASPSHRASAWNGQSSGAIDTFLADGVSLPDLAHELATRSWDAQAAEVGLGCRGVILRSPRGDSTEPAPFGTTEDRDRVKRSWAASKFVPDALRDAVRITPDSPLTATTILLLVPARALEKALLLRFEDADGAMVLERYVNGSDALSSGHPLPPEWVDLSRPWGDPVIRAGEYAARLAAASEANLTFALVTLDKLPRPAARVTIGWARDPMGQTDAANGPIGQVFYVVAATGTTLAEAWRHDWDSTTTQADQDALNTALTQDPDDHALLSPGQPWTVTVAWTATWLKQDARPGPTDTGTAQSTTQSFQFATEPAAQFPRNLTPWLLATSPGMDDVGIFCREPVRIAFAHQQVAQLYAAYGKDLVVVVRAASGKHPAPPGGAPGSPFLVPLLPDAHLSTLTGITALTPWEDAVRSLVAEANADPADPTMPCIDTSGDRFTQTVLTIPYDFEPLTDYLVDVHAVDHGARPTSDDRVARIGFTTSRFLDLGEFAPFIAEATVGARLIPLPTGLTLIADAPTGDQVDAAYQAAGLCAPQTPKYPAVEVLWSGDAVPQPIAVVIESSEPLWRSHLMPTKVTGPIDQVDPTHTWWAARRQHWLSLLPSAVPPGAGDPPRASVTRIVECPGSTRAIAFLAPGSRGQQVRLDLVHAGDPLAGTSDDAQTVVLFTLDAAPWEVED